MGWGSILLNQILMCKFCLSSSGIRNSLVIFRYLSPVTVSVSPSLSKSKDQEQLKQLLRSTQSHGENAVVFLGFLVDFYRSKFWNYAYIHGQINESELNQIQPIYKNLKTTFLLKYLNYRQIHHGALWKQQGKEP